MSTWLGSWGDYITGYHGVIKAVTPHTNLKLDTRMLNNTSKERDKWRWYLSFKLNKYIYFLWNLAYLYTEAHSHLKENKSWNPEQIGKYTFGILIFVAAMVGCKKIDLIIFYLTDNI